MNTKQIHESSDDELTKPVNLTSTSNHQRNKIQQVDSGIEYDRTSPPPSSSSSTIFNQRILNENPKLLFPPVTTKSAFDGTSSSTLVRRLHSTKTAATARTTMNDTIELKTSADSYWKRLKEIWLRSLLLGLLILFILFYVYFTRLDTCSRSTIIRTVFRKIICIEREGLPTI
jgi:hypothetical protein